MKTLLITKETFSTIILGLIQSGVTFEAEELQNGILITFTGGY